MDEKRNGQASGPEPAAEQERAGPAGDEPAPDRPGSDAVGESGELDPAAQLAAEKARAEECHQQLLRLHADFDNFRRRTRQEREEWFRRAAEDVVGALLPVLDNFGRALAQPGDRLDDFLTGIRMIHRQLDEILTAQGLARIPAAGEEFDPNIHEAVARVETGEFPENTVIEELRPGYYFRGKVLRPAMVKVARAVTEENEEGA